MAIAGTTAFANDGFTASADQPKPVAVSLDKAVTAVKAPVLLKSRAPSGRVVRVVKEPVAIPVARKAAMTENTRFIFTSPKNTSTKTYRPAAPKRASMPNLFKD